MTVDAETDTLDQITLLRQASPQENFRLDGVEAFGLAIKAMRKYHPNQHDPLPARTVLKQTVPNDFMWIKNAKAACWALDHLRFPDA